MLLMEHALERLSHLINVVMHPLNLEDGESSTQESLGFAGETTPFDKGRKIEEWIEVSNREKLAIRFYLLRRSTGCSNEKELELLVQQYQAEVVRLLDFVFAEKFKHISSPFARLYEAVLKDLEDILSLIEDRYARYFNLDERVPANYLLVMQTDVRKQIKKIKGNLDRTVERPLVKVVMDPLNAFVKMQSVSHRQLIYVRELVKGLERMPQRGPSTEPRINSDTKELIELLVYMNFNCSAFSGYLIKNVVNDINALHEQGEKIERLAQYQKEFNQMQVKPGVGYKYNAVSLKERVCTWIEEELYYLEKKGRLFSVAPVMRDEAVINEEEKLHIGAPVEVVALLARGAMDAKLILNENMTAVYKTITRCTRTKRAKNPKYGSMLNKSYEAQRSHKQAAIDVLHEMIGWIHGY